MMPDGEGRWRAAPPNPIALLRLRNRRRHGVLHETASRGWGPDGPDEMLGAEKSRPRRWNRWLEMVGLKR